MKATAQATAPPPAQRGKEALVGTSGLLNVIVLAGLAGVLLAIWILAGQHGWRYYTTPLAVRGYAPQHAFLRPSGQSGHLFGIVGTFFLLCTLLYVARKRLKFLSKSGSVLSWLEFHIFCGLFGPILITFHTSFKFNGIVSVAYWSMALVVLSGFVGRYLFVRIPKTIRGQELTQAEVEERARELRSQLNETTLPAHLLARIDDTERALTSKIGQQRTFFQLLAGARETRQATAALKKELRVSGLSGPLLHDALDLVHKRAVLLRRIAQLKRTRQAFQSWHVFHRPLVWVMFFILSIHLGVAVYFGYSYFGK